MEAGAGRSGVHHRNQGVHLIGIQEPRLEAHEVARPWQSFSQ